MEIVTIQPSLQDETHPQYNTGTTLQYAYLAVPSIENYNPCSTATIGIVVVPMLNWQLHTDSSHTTNLGNRMACSETSNSDTNIMLQQPEQLPSANEKNTE